MKQKKIPTKRTQHVELNFRHNGWGSWIQTPPFYRLISPMTMCGRHFRTVFGETDTRNITMRISQTPKNDDAQYVPMTITVQWVRYSTRTGLTYSTRAGTVHFRTGHNKRTRATHTPGIHEFCGNPPPLRHDMANFLSNWLGYGLHELHVAVWEYV